MKKSCNTGQSLVEVVVGLALAILVLGGLINAVVTSLRNSNFAKSQAEATKLAQQRMEWMRIKRDKEGWNSFPAISGGIAYVTGDCYSINSSSLLLTKLSNCNTRASIGTTAFAETISISSINCAVSPAVDYCRKNVKVSVYWTDGTCQSAYCHKSELISYLSRWQ